MIGVLGIILVIGVIAVCVGPFYNCKKSRKSHEDSKDEGSEPGSPVVHIKISHQDEQPEKILGNRVDSKDEEKIIWNSVRGSTKFVPIKPPRNHRILKQIEASSSSNDEAPASIWSAALRNQLQSITNSSAETRCETHVVEAQVEVHPHVSISTNEGSPDSLHRGGFEVGCVDSSRLSHERIKLDVEKEKEKKKPSLVQKKWNNLKQTLKSSKSKGCGLLHDSVYDETQRLSIPVPVASQRSPMGHSTMLRKHRSADASTSPRVSSNVLEPSRSATWGNSTMNNVGLISTEFGQMSSAVSLIKHRSVDGKSICDVRITGLTMSQKELLDLLEATSAKTRTASIVTTEKESIISIKFHRD